MQNAVRPWRKRYAKKERVRRMLTLVQINQNLELTRKLLDIAIAMQEGAWDTSVEGIEKLKILEVDWIHLNSLLVHPSLSQAPRTKF